MNPKIIKLLLGAILFTLNVSAKTFRLTSTSSAKPFSLQINCTPEGKAAFVQYQGQQSFMPLRLKKFTKSVLTNSNQQPESYHYQWDELLNGQINGTYAITEHAGRITEASYVRNSDGKRFNLVAASKNATLDQRQQYLLHGVLITFTWTSIDDQFKFSYPDGKIITPRYLSLDAPDQERTCYIKDYNFDGYDDLAFSLPDAGMGVYHTFNIWLYNPGTKRFEPLKEPTDARAKCSGLCDVTLNPRQKLIYTACRGGARWWQEVYRMGKNNELVWLRSEEKK